jgi:hypothetical protein
VLAAHRMTTTVPKKHTWMHRTILLAGAIAPSGSSERGVIASLERGQNRHALSHHDPANVATPAEPVKKAKYGLDIIRPRPSRVP